MVFLLPFILLMIIFSTERVLNFQFGEHDSCVGKVLQMRELFMKLAFHTSCSDAKTYGFSNWHYLTRFLTAIRANSLRIYSDRLW